jgi:hypothetical protein
MVCQLLNLIRQPITAGGFKRFDDSGMENSPPFLEKAGVCDLMRQGMLEGVDAFGKQLRFIDKLSRLQMRQTTLQYVPR